MNFRDVELLSAYLDGQLNPSDANRLESRLSSDPDLRAVMDDLRAARGLLRQLPAVERVHQVLRQRCHGSFSPALEGSKANEDGQAKLTGHRVNFPLRSAM